MRPIRSNIVNRQTRPKGLISAEAKKKIFTQVLFIHLPIIATKTHTAFTSIWFLLACVNLSVDELLDSEVDKLLACKIDELFVSEVTFFSFFT